MQYIQSRFTTYNYKQYRNISKTSQNIKIYLKMLKKKKKNQGIPPCFQKKGKKTVWFGNAIQIK